MFKNFKLTAKAVANLHSDVEENKPIFAHLQEIAATTDIQDHKKIIGDWKKEARNRNDTFLLKGLELLELDLFRNDERLQKQLEEAEKAVDIDPAATEELQALIKEAQKQGIAPKLRESAQMWGNFNKKALSGDSGSGGASTGQDAGAKSTDSGPKKKKLVPMKK